MKKPEIILRLLRIPFDFVSVVVAFLFSYALRLRPSWIPIMNMDRPNILDFQDFLWFSLQAALLVVLIFTIEGMYSLKKSYRFRKELRRMITFMGASFTIIILYFFIVGVQFFSRFILGLAFILAILFMLFHRFLLRLIQRAFWRKKIGLRRVLFIGAGKILSDFTQLWGSALGFKLLGRLGSDDSNTDEKDLPVLGSIDDLESILKRYRVDEVVQVSSVKSSERIVEFCQLNHVEYRFVPSMLEVQRINTEIDFFQNIPIITLRPSAIDSWARVVKRCMDLILSVFGLVVLLPIYLIIAVMIKCADGGQVFYKSRRVSKDCEFWMWKFRTMIVDADLKKKELMAQSRRKGPLFKIQNDPRITRIGRFLRRSTLDELPQLWNVLIGDMSFVGPRAHLPEEVAQYEKHHRKVLAIKAGLTGLAQVSGRSRLAFEEEVKLDTYYIENWSIWLDIRIIFQTFGVLLEGE